MRHHARKDEPGLDEALAALVRRGFRREIEDAMVTVLTERLPELVEKLRLPARPAQPLGPAPEQTYVTFQQAADITGKSKQTVARWVKAGILKASGPQGDRIKRFELDRMMDTAGAVPGNDTDDVTAEVDKLLNDDE